MPERTPRWNQCQAGADLAAHPVDVKGASRRARGLERLHALSWRRLPGALCLLALLATTGCSTPIGVDEVGFESVYTTLRSNVLDDGDLSVVSRQALAYLGVEDRYEEDPAETVAELERFVSREHLRRGHVVLAELHYDMALETGSRGSYMAAAIHAYIYLFDDALIPGANPYAPEFRMACDLYNRGLAKGRLYETGQLTDGGRRFLTPSGPIQLTVTRSGFPFGGGGFSTFLPADAFSVRGLRTRVRDPGLGVPLIAVQSGDRSGLSADHVGRQIKLPATAFLRIEGGAAELAAGTLTGTLELYLSTDVPTVTLGDRVVPLESDITAPLAHSLEESRIWDFDLLGFLEGITEEFKSGVFMLQPYQPGKIPLVFIHGTASSPAAWAETVNGLLADPILRQRYQVWLGMYNTGNPIAFSAAVQREALRDLVAELDPDQSDLALQRMVLVGHSQGGLLTRLLVTSSGDRIWSSIFDEPFDEHPIEGEARELIESCVFFEPLPFVERAVFISTPHQGSYVAGGWMGKLAKKFVNLPKRLVLQATSLVLGDDLPPELRNMPTSVDNMDPDHRFVKTLATLPFSESVALHSIVAVSPGDDPLEEGNDGVVAYSSAHLEQADSEIVVRHGHSCQGEPATIIELRRILKGHLSAALSASLSLE